MMDLSPDSDSRPDPSSPQRRGRGVAATIGRFRRITLGRAMALIAVIALIMTLIVQARRAAEREARYQAEIARLRAELLFERIKIISCLNFIDY
jgi:hypothetical protein